MASFDKQPLLENKPSPTNGQQEPSPRAPNDTIIDMDMNQGPPAEVADAVQQSRYSHRSPTHLTSPAADVPGVTAIPPHRSPPEDAGGEPHFISSVIPLFGMVASGVVSAFLLGRWHFSPLWTLFIMYGVWEVVRRRVNRFEAYHRNRIDREIAKHPAEDHMETCEWINSIMDRFWAVLEPVVSSQVIDQANKEMAKQCPAFLHSIELAEFTLGSSAPHVMGARVYPQTSSDIIHLDLICCFVPNEVVERDFIPKPTRGLSMWNSKILLKARVGTGMVGVDVPVLVKEILFYGRFRIQVQLAANIPFVQTVDFCFLEPPKIDFILKPLQSVDIMDLPGLSRFLFSLINTNIAKQMVNPNKISIDVAQILKAKKKTRMNSIGVLKVKILQTRGIKDTEDASVRLSIAGRLKAETAKLEKGEDEWNELHYILIPSLSYPITFTVMKSSRILSSPETIGMCKVSTEAVASGDNAQQFANIWKEIISRSSSSQPSAELNVGVEYYPAEYVDDEGEQDPKKALDKVKTEAVKVDKDGSKRELPKTHSGILQVTIHGAKDLPIHPAKKEWSTFVEASVSNFLAEDAIKKHTDDDMNPYIFKSKTKKANSPSWEETFEFLVVDYDVDDMWLRLRDAKDDYPLGELCAKVRDILDVTDWFSLSGAESGKIYVSTIFKPVNIPIENPQSLKYAPAMGVLSVKVLEGHDFKKRIELQGKQEYYVELAVNGKSVRKTRTVKTMENPLWNETINGFVRADTDTVTLKLLEEHSIRKDSGEGSLRIPMETLINSPSTTKIWAEALVESGKTAAESDGERLKFEATYYLVGDLKLAEPKEGELMVSNGSIKQDSNSGILEVRGVALWGLPEKTSGKKLNCLLSLSSLPGDTIATKYRRSGGTSNKFSWDMFAEFFVIDHAKNSLWLVFEDEGGALRGEGAAVASISIPVALLASGKDYDVPGIAGAKMSVLGQYRGIPGMLQAPVESTGLLKIDVIRASVVAVDAGGTSDPFVTVKLNGKTVFKTKVIKKTVTPEWKESCEVRIEDRPDSKISFEVTDWNQVMMSQPLGRYEVNMASVPPDKDIPMQCKLEDVSTGTLWINMFYETQAGKSATGAITAVPALSKERASEGIVGTAADVTKGAVTGSAKVVTGGAKAVGSVAGHTAGATKVVAQGAASAVTSTASAMKSGVSSVFGLARKDAGETKKTDDTTSNGPHTSKGPIEHDLKITIKQITGNPEITQQPPFDCALAVYLDGRDRLHRTRTVRSSHSPDWGESFEVSSHKLKHGRFIEFVPETTLSLDAFGLAPGDRPVFRLDLSRPELHDEEGTSFNLFLNDREDDPPLTLAVEARPTSTKGGGGGLGRMFGKVKFGK